MITIVILATIVISAINLLNRSYFTFTHYLIQKFQSDRRSGSFLVPKMIILYNIVTDVL